MSSGIFTRGDRVYFDGYWNNDMKIYRPHGTVTTPKDAKGWARVRFDFTGPRSPTVKINPTALEPVSVKEMQ